MAGRLRVRPDQSRVYCFTATAAHPVVPLEQYEPVDVLNEGSVLAGSSSLPLGSYLIRVCCGPFLVGCSELLGILRVPTSTACAHRLAVLLLVPGLGCREVFGMIGSPARTGSTVLCSSSLGVTRLEAGIGSALTRSLLLSPHWDAPRRR